MARRSLLVLVLLLLIGPSSANFNMVQTTSTVSVPFFTNFTASNLSVLRAAMVATGSNSADTKFFYQGDSSIVGLGASASNQTASNIIAQTAGLVSNSSWQSVFFDHNFAGCSGFNTLDGRFTADANCVSFGSLGALGGNPQGSSDPHTDGWHFTPLTSFDTLDICYDTTGNGGSFTIGYDGGAVSSTISPGGVVNGFSIATITTTLGIHTIDQKNVSQSAGQFAQCVIARKSATKQILHLGGGISGAASADFTSTASPLKYLNALITLAPHAVLAENGISNDWGTGVPLATSQANITTIVTALQAANINVILTTGVPWNPSIGVSQATQVTYQQMVLALARTLGVPCIDTFGKFVDFNTANGLGWMSDGQHPNGTGYGVIAAMIATVLNNPNFRSTELFPANDDDLMGLEKVA